MNPSCRSCRLKLGLADWGEESASLWDELFGLMSNKCGAAGAPAPACARRRLYGSVFSRRPSEPVFVARQAANLLRLRHRICASGIDFTLFFRGLSEAPSPPQSALASSEALLTLLVPAALEDPTAWPEGHREAWTTWLRRYWAKVEADGRLAVERQAEMCQVNPKYILRNWMAQLAYEAAAQGDTSVLQEVHDVLKRPYDDHGEDVAARWAQRTPTWARDKPGIAFMT